ncbi:multiheme c-type cytochrome [Neptuniibacter halophilus]|uniref:multiheme c-type cytochrome n=1 Tax=Neptuniibacter halophilus TaxID=651666 RepID=UPI0025726B51|nr:multiheme c-type cytochrome [Neptuniibacter halophilus]
MKSVTPVRSLLLCLTSLFFSANPAAADYIGSTECGTCHTEQLHKWQQSHHKQAMTPVEEIQLPQFDGQVFELSDRTIHFIKKHNSYLIREQQEGQHRDYPVRYALGFYPLQQYLVDVGQGKLQVFDIAWDSRSAEAGGQRWFSVNNEPDHDSLNWKHSLMNWNSRCASCHTTAFNRDYSPSSGRYNSHWTEPHVGCESCHGPGRKHLDWALGKIANAPQKGLNYLLSSPQNWNNRQPQPKSTGTPNVKLDETEICFNCHARRQLLKNETNNEPFSETSTLRLLEPELYFPDGQIKDEVFVAGSFLQSKMYRAGVTCSNCHDPHNNELTQPGNKICTQCHSPQTYDTQAHHQHADNSGSACVSCHMPSRTYMGVDERHDHGFQVPDPMLSLQLNTPNVCAQCHQEASSRDWLKQQSTHFSSKGQPNNLRRRTAHLLADLWQQKRRPGWQQEFEELLQENSSDFLKASLLQAAPLSLKQPELAQLIRGEPSLLTTIAINQLQQQPAPGLLESTLQQLSSSSLKVRISAYRALMPYNLSYSQQQRYGTLLTQVETEYIRAIELNQDTPMGRTELANYHLFKGHTDAALKHMQEALKSDPGLLIAALNLADLYRQKKQDRRGLEVLIKAQIHHPDNHLLAYSIGLTYVRLSQSEPALQQLKKAYEDSGQQLEFGMTLLVAMNTFNYDREANALKHELLTRFPDDPRLRQLIYH